MKSFQSYQRRINVLGNNMRERAENEGKRNYELYLEEVGTRQNLQITDVNEPFITSKTKTVPCTIISLGYNDEKNFDQKKLTVPYDTNVGVGSYVLWGNITYLVIFEQHIPIPSHKSFVIRPCNSSYHCFDSEGKEVEVPMSAHNLTLYSDGLRKGKFLDYENGKRKVLIPNNTLTSSNLKVGQLIFFSKFNTFKITSIDDYSMVGLFVLVMEQTLKNPADNVTTQITQQQQEEEDNKNKKDESVSSETSEISITGAENIKIGFAQKYKLINYNDSISEWKIVGTARGIAVQALDEYNCQVTIPSKGSLIGMSITLQAICNGKVIAQKNVEIEGLL